ncbi:putative disease resistance protein RGA4 [Phragmites australis]|uniref:putative disease resistance protein RGA4 n=1 Tax=Phragmites australis TaxID=29695 RepID=UPI002D7A03EB|nr:putative disease resistance protein RGA4 [Phragmites australis]
MEGTDLKIVLDMLLQERMEKRFRLLRAGTLLSELRSAVSFVHKRATVSKGVSLRLTFSARSLATPLRELLEALLLRTEVKAQEWRQVPAVLYRYLDFRSNTIRDLRQFLHKFSSLCAILEPNSRLDRYWNDRAPLSMDALQEPMVGRSELLDEMVSILLADRAGHRQLLMMPIVGGPGVGKTRLATAILEDDRVWHGFRVLLGVSVARDFRRKGPQGSPADALQYCSPEAVEMVIRHKLISGGDYLILLDDVWSDHEGEWKKIGDMIDALPPRGRVVLTTRTPDIASKLANFTENTNTTKTFYLQPLGQEFSPSFVARWIATRHGDWPAEVVREAGTKIADKCGGIPLLLDRARRVFSQPPNMMLWQGLLENAGSKIHPGMLWRELPAYIDRLPSDEFWQRFLWHVHGEVVFQSAAASFRHLPADLQSCFLYCSMFPLDYDFDVEELADLLAAQGYIPPIVAQSLRKGFLQQLLDECFYPLQEHKYGDKPTYRMHKVLHIFAQYNDWEFSSIIRVDQATQIASEAKAQSTFRIQRASLIVHPSTASFPTSLHAYKYLGALILLQGGPMCLSEQPRCEITEIPQVLFQSCRLIHTLSFRATKTRVLPTKFLEPDQVKYLNLSQTAIENIPSSISRLTSLLTLVLSHCHKIRTLHPNTTKLTLLQKLDLEGCCNLVKLPRDMGKMKSLEYLNVTDCSSLTQLPRGMGQLKSLQMLLGYIVSYTDGSSMSELQPLANLHRLRLQSLEKVSDLTDVRYASLQNKTKLESLSMRWNMDDANKATLAYTVLESLQPPQCLKALEIISYEGKKLPSWMKGPEPYLMSLVEIKLINLRSCKRVLDPLGLLPCLKIAEISGAETVCIDHDNSYGHKGIFPSLEKLTFSYMHNLEVWEQAHRAGMFPRLAELAIIQCPKLRELHMELLSVEKLILWMNNKMLYDLKGALRGVAKSLKHISISFSEELLASSDCEGLQDLGNLTKLEICGCHELTCLSQGFQHLSSMRSLTIDNCSKLETLPDWLENLPSLQSMRLSGCPLLRSIPGGLQQRPGVIVYVEDCPNLPEQPFPNIPAQPLEKPVATRVNKGKEIVIEDD